MSICKEGTLKIKLHDQSKWHRRYCTIDWDKSILFIASRADSRYRNWIKLLPDTLINEYDHFSSNESANNNNNNNNSSLANVIEIKADKETAIHLLQADTKIDFDDWLVALKRTAYSRVGGGIFGQSLEETYQYSADKTSLVPLIIRQCCEYLLEYGSTFVGLFRVPGKQSSIKELRDRYDRGLIIELNSSYSPATISSLLKIYLQSLPEPIIPRKNFDDFLEIGSRFKYNQTQDLNNLKQLIENNLSNINYAVLAYLSNFLKKLTDHVEITKMDTDNLALVFGNNLIRPVEELDLNMIRGHNYNLIPLIKVLIDYSDYLFPKDGFEHSTTKSSGFSSFSSLLSSTENSLTKNSRSSSMPSIYMATCCSSNENENQLKNSTTNQPISSRISFDVSNQKKRSPSTDLLESKDRSIQPEHSSRPISVRKMEKYPNRKSFANKFGKSLNSIKSSMSKALQSHAASSSSNDFESSLTNEILLNQQQTDRKSIDIEPTIKILQNQIYYLKELLEKKDLLILELTNQSHEEHSKYEKNINQLNEKIHCLEKENMQLQEQLNMQ